MGKQMRWMQCYALDLWCGVCCRWMDGWSLLVTSRRYQSRFSVDFYQSRTGVAWHLRAALHWAWNFGRSGVFVFRWPNPFILRELTRNLRLWVYRRFSPLCIYSRCSGELLWLIWDGGRGIVCGWWWSRLSCFSWGWWVCHFVIISIRLRDERTVTCFFCVWSVQRSNFVWIYVYCRPLGDASVFFDAFALYVLMENEYMIAWPWIRATSDKRRRIWLGTATLNLHCRFFCHLWKKQCRTWVEVSWLTTVCHRYRYNVLMDIHDSTRS